MGLIFDGSAQVPHERVCTGNYSQALHLYANQGSCRMGGSSPACLWYLLTELSAFFRTAALPGQAIC